MTISLYGEINVEMLDKFLSSFSLLEEDDVLVIYFHSEGGLWDVQEVMIDIINKFSDRFELIASGEIKSAAFNIFYSVKCKRDILPFTSGMAHIFSQGMDINGFGKPKTEYDRNVINEIKLGKKESMKFFENLGIPNQKLSKIRKGEDVYFNYSQLKGFLDNQKS